jgi:hypothetical protein
VKSVYWATCEHCKQKIATKQQGKLEWIVGGKYSFTGYVPVHRKCPASKRALAQGARK